MNLIREREHTTHTRKLKATLIIVVAMQRDDIMSNDTLIIAKRPKHVHKRSTTAAAPECQR